MCMSKELAFVFFHLAKQYQVVLDFERACMENKVYSIALSVDLPRMKWNDPIETKGVEPDVNI